MPKDFVSAACQTMELATNIANEYSKNEKSLYTVIRCEKSNAYYAVEGDGGIIRIFESIVAQFENGKQKM